MLAAVRLPAFALLWSGWTISRIGDGIFAVAVAWWIVEHAGPQARGAYLAVTFVPTLMFLLFAGALVDSLPRSRVLLASDAIHGVAIALTAVLALQGRLTISALLLLAIVIGTMTAFFYPAAQAVLPELVPAELRASANALNRVSRELTGILGPPVGALLVATIGTGGAFAVDAATFAVSAGAILGIGRRAAHPRAEAETFPKQLTGGLRVVLTNRWLWVTILVAGISNVTMAGPESVALPFLVKDNLHADARLYGVLLASSAAGAVAVSLVMGRIARLHGRGLVAYGAWLLAAVGLAITGLVLAPLAAILAMTVFGAGIAVLELVWIGSLQDPDIVPPSLLGRVSAIDALGSYALLPIAFAGAGLATAAFGAPAVLIAGGVASIIVIGSGLLFGVRRFD